VSGGTLDAEVDKADVGDLMHTLSNTEKQIQRFLTNHYFEEGQEHFPRLARVVFELFKVS
jgi:hypothetical protein